MRHLRGSRAGPRRRARLSRQVEAAPTVERRDGGQPAPAGRNAVRPRRCLGAVAVAVAALICAGPAVARSDGRGGGDRVVPAHVIHGLTGGELVGVDFARDYSGAPTPDCLRLGRRSEILQVGPNGATITCTVKPGTPIFVFGFGAACTDVDAEDSGFFAIGEAAQRRCAREQTQAGVLAVHVTVDGGAAVDIRSDRFEVTSPQMTAALPEDNPFGLPAGTTAHLVGDIYAAAIRSLPPGRHTVVVDVLTVFDPSPFGGTTIVDVAPGA
jgi:hypothetical protein